MVKLPISDYVSNYYKEQGIVFTLRQQAHICWQYNDLMKDQLNSIREILEISDDEKLNTEIRERIAYEEKAYERFIEGQEGCIYIVHPDVRAEESHEIYFATAKKAISYGVCHIKQAFVIAKIWLFDKNPKWLSEEADHDDSKGGNETLSRYRFTKEGNVTYGVSWEYKEPFDIEDCNRFENMYLYIKSPFDLGDIVMGPDWERPEVVSTDHDCFIEHYDRLKARGHMEFEGFENIIRTDLINADGSLDYAHTVPFHLWKIDSWEDKEYWKLLQIMSEAVKKGIDLYDFGILRWEYEKRNEKREEK